MAKGDTFYIDGQPYVEVWSSDEMTDADHYESLMKTAALMESYGLRGDLQRMLAQKYLDTEKEPSKYGTHGLLKRSASVHDASTKSS